MKIKRLLCLCLLVLGALSGCASQKKIDLDAGTTLFFEGFNGKGTGIVDTTMMDDLGLEAKMLELSEKTLTLMFEGKSYEKVEQQYTKLYEFARSLDCTWDRPNGTYSNGDEAIYSCSFDEEAAKKAGYTYINTESRYVVEGLEEIQEIDLFEGIDFEWNFYTSNSSNIDLNLINNNPNAWVQKYVDYTYSINQLDDEGNFNVLLNYSTSDLEQAGYSYSGPTTKSFNIGVKPIYLKEVVEEDEKAQALKSGTAFLENLLDHCDNTFLYRSTEPVIVKGYEFAYYRTPGLLASNVATNFYLIGDNNLRYTISIKLDLYRMADGSFYDLSKSEYSCDLSSKGESTYSFTRYNY
ncbi:MAG: hypothetical protein ACRCZJ_07670 [Erysipelotrichaceae bacterium]